MRLDKSRKRNMLSLCVVLSDRGGFCARSGFLLGFCLQKLPNTIICKLTLSNISLYVYIYIIIICFVIIYIVVLGGREVSVVFVVTFSRMMT